MPVNGGRISHSVSCSRWEDLTNKIKKWNYFCSDIPEIKICTKMSMKKIIGVIALTVMASSATFAQRFAYVDTEYILKHIPEYLAAQKQLDALSVQWQE